MLAKSTCRVRGLRGLPPSLVAVWFGYPRVTDHGQHYLALLQAKVVRINCLAFANQAADGRIGSNDE